MILRHDDLKGVYTALMSPVVHSELDTHLQDKLIKEQIGIVNGLVLFGTTGQNPVFSWEEQIARMIYIQKQFGDKTNLIYCISSNSTQEVISNIRKLEKEVGPSTILTTTGYYNKPGQQGQIEHYNTISEFIQGKLIIYEVPGRTNTSLDDSSWKKLNLNRIIGVKDATSSAGELDRIQFFKKLGLYYFTGEDGTFGETLVNGGEGIISASSNASPLGFKGIYDRNISQVVLDPLVEYCFHTTNPVPLAELFNTEVKLPLSIRDADPSALKRLKQSNISPNLYSKHCILSNQYSR